MFHANKIGHFRVHISLHFEARLSAKSLLWKSVFIHIEIGTNYHDKNFALRLALKERLKGTRKWPIGMLIYRHQEFQFPLGYAAHLGTESERQVLNGSHIFVSFTRILLFGNMLQCSRKRRQDEEEKQKSDKAAIRDLVLTFCPSMRSVQQRKLKLLMPVLE